MKHTLINNSSFTDNINNHNKQTQPKKIYTSYTYQNTNNGATTENEQEKIQFHDYYFFCLNRIVGLMFDLER